jgi:uncharacterized protein (TIGR03067 family)
MPRRFYLILVVCLLTAGGGPSAESGVKNAGAKDLAKLQGKWRVVAEDSDGTVTKIADGHGHVIGFDKEIMIGYDADGGVATKDSIKLDPSKSPKAIDATCVFNVLYPKNKGHTIHGIYQLQGDELKLAFPYAPFRERPKEFTTKKGSHFIVATYKRLKP